MLTVKQAIQANEFIHLPLSEFYTAFERLGYKIDRSMDSYSVNKFMTGEYAGESYLAINTGIKEKDTGRSAFHIDSRRDDNFRAMQELRGKICAVINDKILEV